MKVSVLDWRFLNKQDRRARQEFTCAEPAAAHYVRGHPRRWELEPQSALRVHVVKPGQSLLGGIDPQGIAAMSLWDATDQDVVRIYALGVSTRWRRQGGGVARELLERTKNRIVFAAAAQAVTTLTIAARVDHRNEACQRLCTDAGFTLVERVAATPYDQWELICSTRNITID